VRRSRSPIAKPARGAALALVLALLAAPGAALAQCPRTSLADIEDEVMCPVCGVPLSLATEAPQAERERAFIVERVERCQSKDEIKAALVAEFGEGVLTTPGDQGFDLAAYALPAAAVLAGAGAIGVATLRWRRSRRAAGAGAAAAAESPAQSRADSARLEADIERYDL
jgi:cytochrome c-type biogenesis protein CcmH